MAYTTTIPGLPGGPLTTSFPVKISLIPASRTYQRPGLLLRGNPETCQHMTANWASLAAGEARYFVNGAEGRQASVHAVIDDTECWILLPLNEVGWHAGDGAGPGNYSTVALELCQQRAMVNDPKRWRRAIQNAAEFMGRVAARKGADDVGKLHHDYSSYKKWCPAVLLDRPSDMAFYRSEYKRFHALERKAMAGEKPTPDDSVIMIGDTIRALVNLNVRSRPTTAAPVLGTIMAGVDVVVNGRWESADGYGWLPVASPFGDGAVAMGADGTPWVQKVGASPAPEPEPKPVYVSARPIPALLETDLQKYDTAEGITTDDTGNEFVFVADVIEFTTETVAGEFAVENPRPVKAPFKKGDRAIAAWLVKAKHGAWFYVLTGGTDEWVRIPYQNTKRISDAPLLGDQTP